MSNEPEKNIESLLRAYRDQRRSAGEPTPLHPATRNLLQAEVARTFGAKAVHSGVVKRPWYEGWWTRVALVSSICAMAAFVLFQMQQTAPPKAVMTDEIELHPVALASAKKDEVEELKRNHKDDQSSAGALAPEQRKSGTARYVADDAKVSAPELAKADADKKVVALGLSPARPLDRMARPVATQPMANPVVTPREMLDAASSPAPTPMAPVPTLLSRKLGELPDQPTGASKTLAYAVPMPMSRSVVESKVESQTAQLQRAEKAENVQFYRQVPAREDLRRNYNSPPLPAVLTSFQMDFDGDKIRIIDADGSLYEGRLIAAEQDVAGKAKEAAGSGLVKNMSDRNRSSDPAENALRFNRLSDRDVVWSEYDFYVTGTNRQLNQVVEFSGALGANNEAQTATRSESGDVSASRKFNLRGVSFAFTNPVQAQLSLEMNAFDRNTNTLKFAPVIRGRAKVGQRDEFEIRAVPTAKP